MGVLINRKQEQDADSQYVCRGCGEAFGLEHYICPECGGYSVERSQAGRSVDSDSHSRTLGRRVVLELKRRFTINQRFTESNTAKVQK
jgi:predicted RNA-binding Zn-ribbon protein involved in translation (DUF1610 family)